MAGILPPRTPLRHCISESIVCPRLRLAVLCQRIVRICRAARRACRLDRLPPVALGVAPTAAHRGRSCGASLRPLAFDRAPHRGRGRPFRDPALDPPDQLCRLILGTLVDAVEPNPHPSLNDARGIHDDDAKEAPAGIAVREPKTRHGPESRQIGHGARFIFS
jgi:hypothetical protein